MTDMGEGLSFDLQQIPNPVDVEMLIANLVEFNDSAAPPERYSPIAVFARFDGILIGGVSGLTHWNWLFVSQLWVAGDHRGAGIGSRLMSIIECAAIDRGATAAHLNTFDFQGLGFYRARGYRDVGSLRDFPIGHELHFLAKVFELSQTAPYGR